jgi:hypothetical protein
VRARQPRELEIRRDRQPKARATLSGRPRN